MTSRSREGIQASRTSAGHPSGTQYLRRFFARLAIGQILRDEYVYEVHGPFVPEQAAKPDLPRPLGTQASLAAALAVMLGIISAITQTLAGGVLPLHCAAQDLRVFTLIEKHGEDQTRPADLVASAFMDLISARRACNEGREAEAAAIYAEIGTRLAGQPD
ncbi:MAG TPA: hypothetical protein VGN91_15370 [Bosea sp. (in: a-proteobacteria)]|nr:hypothetical protein [Bosea sp. (in: a-proteobacteria)]